jgi:DNA-nicking Smr family endonuclease
MAKPRGSARDAQRNDSPDAALFRAAVRDVKPLEQAPRAHESGKPRKHPRAAPKPRAFSEAESDLPLLAENVSADEAVSGSEALSFRRPGVRTQTLRQLRRGLYPIEDALDLHGLSQAEARSSLAEFLEQSRLCGHRCVRIVHGKGYRSGARGPVLKIAVNTWLKRHADVVAFTSARTIDGGTGAVYVLLRA